MSGIYEWIRNLVCYLIFLTMILNLLPDRKYEKYLRLFAGAVLLLLIFSPLTKRDGLEMQIAGLFERLTFQNEAKLLQKEIENMEQAQMDRLTERFLKSAEEQIHQMAGEANLHCKHVNITADTGPDAESFGKILNIELSVTVQGMEARELRAEANRRIQTLKKKIGEYYGLEESHIAVRLENMQG